MPQTPAQKAAQKKWKAENRAKLAAYARAWREKNPEKARANFTRWRKRHPEKYRAMNAANKKQWAAKNKEKIAADAKQWAADNYSAVAHAVRKSQYTRKYGITIAQYEAMLLRQNGVCAICASRPGKRRLAVDHCHTTKAIRGLLCFNCNIALGKFKDSPSVLERAIAYLFFYQ